MFVLDDDLVSTLVFLGRALHSVLGLVCRCVDVLDGQARTLVEPLGVSTRVGVIRDGHDEGLAGISHQVLIGGFDLWNSWRRKEKVRV